MCVILSGHNDFAYAKEAIQHQVMEYLLKPVNDDELSEVLRKIEKNLLTFQEEFEMANNTSFQKPENIAELVEEYIHKHYMELLELGEIAEKFGFSVSYLTKIFTKFTGKTPSKYIRDYRISLAVQSHGEGVLRAEALAVFQLENGAAGHGTDERQIHFYSLLS